MYLVYSVMGRRATISITSLKILQKVVEDPGVTQSEISEELDISYAATSRYIRGEDNYGFLSELIERRNVEPGEGSDGREKGLYISDGVNGDADRLVDALNIIEQYN